MYIEYLKNVTENNSFEGSGPWRFLKFDNLTNEIFRFENCLKFLIPPSSPYFDAQHSICEKYLLHCSYINFLFLAFRFYGQFDPVFHIQLIVAEIFI